MEAYVNNAANVITIGQFIGQIIYTVYKNNHKKSKQTLLINQLERCLKDTWKETATQNNWENKKVPDEFLLNNETALDKKIESIQEKLNTLNSADSECFRNNFRVQLSTKYTELNNYIMTLNIDYIVKILKKSIDYPPPPVKSSYILTPKRDRTKDSSILGREDFVTVICQELCKPQEKGSRALLQLTGMGGIGKSEILKIIYAKFANNEIPKHTFKHIALLHYNDTLSNSLITGVDDLEGKCVDDAWNYMINLCNKGHTLLLIDDTRKKEETETPDDSFERLFSLYATVLIASREQVHKKFKAYPVGPLDIEYCIEIFEEIFKDNSHEHNISFPLEPNDEKLLTDIIKNHAGHNPLIVRRLSAIAHDGKYTIDGLNNKLKESGFDIRKGAKDKEKLQEEINKLYPLSNIKEDSDKSLLEAFALFPSDQILDLTKCIEWLCEDAVIDESECRFDLQNLANSTWLIEDGNGYAMHQVVQTAITTQSKNLQLNKHNKLLVHLLEDVSFSDIGTFRKAIPYIKYAVSFSDFWNEKHVEDANLANLMGWIGLYSDDRADYSKALEWYRKALAITEKVLGKEHPSTATTYNNIAGVYDNQGNYEEALEWYRKALAITEKVLGKEHPNTVSIYKNIARIYDNQSD